MELTDIPLLPVSRKTPPPPPPPPVKKCSELRKASAGCPLKARHLNSDLDPLTCFKTDEMSVQKTDFSVGNNCNPLFRGLSNWTEAVA